jgi:hypothetical protein
MIRQNGEYVIYIIKHSRKKSDGDDWDISNLDHFFVDTDEYSEFTASGNCWQITSVHGTFDPVTALTLRQQFADKYFDYNFIVVKVTISQRSELYSKDNLLNDCLLKYAKLTEEIDPSGILDDSDSRRKREILAAEILDVLLNPKSNAEDPIQKLIRFRSSKK